MVRDRVRWAVELVDPRPGEHVLEVGGGPGVAAELVCERLGHGSMLTLDRSCVAVERAAKRAAAHVAAGRLTVRQAELAGAELAPGTFDKAFCLNVNLFWTGDPAVEVGVLHDALRPGGRLWILYGSGPGRVDHVLERVRAALERGGFVEVDQLRAEPGFGVAARRRELPSA